jgi:DNA-directed RNA polymerase sigma subunit (sigma70/sigma32)
MQKRSSCNEKSWLNSLKAEDFTLDDQELYMRLSGWTKGDFNSWLVLVKKRINSYVNKYIRFECGAFDRSDLEVYAFEVLLNNIEKFNPSRQTFEEFLNFHLSHRLPEEVSRLRSAVTSGSDLNERRNRVMKCRKEFIQEYGFEPSVEELAEMSGYSVKQVKEAIDLYNQSNGVLSLNNLCNDSSNEYMDFVEDEAESFEDKAEVQYSGEQMLKQINAVLTEDEADVIKWLFGFNDGEKHSEQEVADILGYNSRQNVHNIKKKALEKLSAYYLQSWDSAA